LFTLVFIIAVLAVAIFFLSRTKKEKSGSSWVQFYAKGKEAGFSFKEMELLRRLAVRCNIENPSSLYWSQAQLDMCIRTMVRGIRMSGEGDEQGTQDFLSKLYDYRKKIEMEKPKVKNGITSSRQISEGQPLRILLAGTGVFKSNVIKVSNTHLTISRPINNKISNVSWGVAKISVYFTREDDAGYVFDAVVEDEVFSKGISSLKIPHSDALFRTQKRKSVRVKIHLAAFLYLLNEENKEDAGKIEMIPGLKCFIEDLSDCGCAIAVGGKATDALRIKVQFVLDNSAVCMCGTIRSVDFIEEKNRSLLHVQADPLPTETRNQILAEVFGMLPNEDDEDLPFRVLDEEASGESLEESPAPMEELGAADE